MRDHFLLNNSRVDCMKTKAAANLLCLLIRDESEEGVIVSYFGLVRSRINGFPLVDSVTH